MREFGADTAFDANNERFGDVAKEVDVVSGFVAGETQGRLWEASRGRGIMERSERLLRFPADEEPSISPLSFRRRDGRRRVSGTHRQLTPAGTGKGEPRTAFLRN